MNGHQKLPPKKEVALALLEGPSMFVHLDPRRPGVLIPPRFRDKPQLVLQIGLNMFVPIPDLQVDEEGITCTLSFDRSPFWVRMPWNAVYALVGEDGRGMMWPNDIPPEVVAQMQNTSQPQQPQQQAQKPQRETPAPKQAPRKHARPKLSAVGQPPPRESRVDEIMEEPPPVSAQTEVQSNTAPASDGSAARTAEPEPEATPSAPEELARKPATSTAGRKPKRELPPYLRVIK